MRAQTLDATNRTGTLSDGTTISVNEPIIATALRTRRLPNAATLTGVHVLRSVDDSQHV